MSEFIPGRGINPGQGLLTLAAKICRDEPNTDKVGIGFPRAYNWTPLTDGLFDERIEVRGAKVGSFDDPYNIVEANFIIEGPAGQELQVSKKYVPELETDPYAVSFFRRFHKIYFDHMHDKCTEAERIQKIIARGETPLFAQRGLSGEVLRFN